MTIKRICVHIGIGISAIVYNVFKIVRRASQPPINLTNKNFTYKRGFMVGSYGLLIFGILIIFLQSFR